MIRPKKKLVLENGMVFHGVGFGADRRSVCEIVFNTSVVGYQEIISDLITYGCSWNRQDEELAEQAPEFQEDEVIHGTKIA